LYIATAATVSLDAFTLALVSHNYASTSHDDIDWRSRVASAAVQLFQGGKALVSRAGQAVARWLPPVGWCGI
jgi:hypothetical protein